MFSSLAGRWADEKEYEDISDYEKPLKSIAAEYGIKIIKMNTRPFGFNFESDKRIYKMIGSFRSNGGFIIQYKRIA